MASLSRAPQPASCQAPLAMRFSRQGHWSDLLSPSPGGLPDPGIEPYLLRWQAGSLLLSHRGSSEGGMRREIWSKDNALQEFTARKREERRQPLQWATFARVWYLLDGKMQPPGKLAALASVRLQGLHKPVYHQLSDCGDHVVIMNTRHIAFSGNKWEQKVYSSHTGYPGGFKQVTAAQLHRKDPVAIVKLAIYGMLPKNLHRRTLMQRLHLFPDEDIPEDILKNLTEELPQPRKVPRRLDEYTQEEIEAFPRVWSPPEDYRL